MSTEYRILLSDLEKSYCLFLHRDSLISQLQQQIDDLTLFLEEERLNHRETKRRAADQLRDKLDDLGNQHENYVRYKKT